MPINSINRYPYRETIEPDVLQWPDFQRLFLKEHKQGEHIAFVGQTGSGKTTAELEICKLIGLRKGADGRPTRVAVFGTKPRDDTLAALNAQGWPIIKKWPPAYGEEHCIVWPRADSASTAAAKHRAVFQPLMDSIYGEGGQTICIDEASYFELRYPEGLDMAPTMGQFWSAARSNKLTLVAGTQRPRNVSRLMWSEPSWVIVFPPDDEDDLKRVAELSGRKWDVLAVAEKLGGFEFLCIQRQRGGGRGLYVSRIDK